MKISLTGGRIVDPINDRDGVAELCIDGDRIVAVGRRPKDFKPDRVIDARGQIVCPGFTELSAHLREPGGEHKATIASELEAAAAAGFTTVCCTPDTSPAIDTPAVVELINQRARHVRGARVRCIGALTQGLHGEVLAEMHALKAIGCVGVSNAARAISDTAVLKNALAYAATLDLLVFLRPEDPWLGAEGVMHEGAASTRAGLAGIASAAELIGLARDLLLVEQTGARAHFTALSVHQSVAQLRAAQRRGLNVSADVGIAHLHLCDEDIANYDAQLHVRPPLRSKRDRSGLRRALASGHIQALSCHHEPHDADAKAAPFAASEAGFSGFDTFVPLMLELVAQGALDLAQAVTAAAVAPAQILRLDSGSLAVGALADLCVIDPEAQWTVSANDLHSAGKNTPFGGAVMHGRVSHTLVAGRVVFER